ncbi:YggT family protein [Psychrobacter sp. PL15]|uniref:YggT family protein n=1 Tax=unclassified Psychrobacter TaxID=196806 RepID=UPI001AE84D61|nr:YggT family protein [Psychrobacter sp. PL15]MEC5209600.1 YggT family protein [Psychrobacter sp. PL15]
MNNMLLQIFDLVTTFAMLLVFIRFMLQFADMDASDPMIRPAYKATHIVDVFGRIFPTVAQGRISIAAIVLMLLIRLIDISGKAALTQQGIAPVPLFFTGSVSLVLDFLRMCRYLVIGSIIVSWIVVFTNSSHPVIGIIMRLAEPILAPFRRITPNLGMLDLSPMVAFFAFYLLEIFIGGLASNFMPMLG